MKKYLDLKFDSSADVNFMATAGEDSIEMLAAEKDGDGKPKRRKFKIRLYNGGPMFVGGFFQPIVIDLAGMKVSKKSRPILLNHDPRTPLGHTSGVEIGAKDLRVEGEFSFDNENTKDVISSADGGFPWQASVGARVESIERVAEGETGEANGRKFKGPVLIARKSEFKEGSFVPLGADDSTSVKVAANLSAKLEEMEKDMKFKDWLKARGLVATEMSEAELKAAQKIFDSLVEAKDPSTQITDSEPEKKKVEANDLGQINLDDIEKRIADTVAATVEKVVSGITEKAEVTALCGDNKDLHAQALKEKWSPDKTKDQVELATLRGGRPNGQFAIHASNDVEMNENILCASIMQSGKLDEKAIESQCGEKAMEAADKAYKGRMGLQDLIYVSAKLNGYKGSAMTFRQDMSGVFQAAFGRNVSAAFSTIVLPNMLSNIANKFFIDAFNFEEQTWREVSAVGRVNDFKQTTRLTLTSDMIYKIVAPGGQITHGEVSEEVYTNQADTFARLMSIDRTTLINDDLGALTTMPAQLGKGAIDAFNLAFWTEFLDNASFFTAPRGNLTSGQAFGIDEVTAMETAFFDQTKPNGTPYGSMPEIILVPNALNVLANQIVRDTGIELDGSSSPTKIPNGNPHAGRFSVSRSSFLSNATIPGSSTIATYMLSRPGPGKLNVIESVFLDGQETPTIETGEVDFTQLGVQFRGWHDFGMNKQEFREGVKSAGV